ncbi:plasma-membrane choline transporter-domain-containing protein [Neocallimastix lanati (nom. inval.)]|nr:plasma-membrane choline transporter-domain-containing protein [Neocallimastix sp. JGI-2020a]
MASKKDEDSDLIITETNKIQKTNLMEGQGDVELVVEEKEDGIPHYRDVWAIFVFIGIFIATLILSIRGLRIVIDKGRPKYVQSILKEISSDLSYNNVTSFNETTDATIIYSVKPLNASLSDKSYNNENLTYNTTENISQNKIKRSRDEYTCAYLIFTLITIALTVVGYIYTDYNYFIYGALFVIVQVATVIMIKKWRSRVAFGKIVLKTSVKVMKAHIATVYVGYLESAIGALLDIIIAFGIYGLAFEVVYDKEVIDKVTGLYGEFFFNSTIENGKIRIKQKDPTLESFKRSLTTSFGSICMGGLIITPAEYTKKFLKIFNYYLTLSGCCCFYCCFSGCIQGLESLLKYFNSYAFVEVALTGKGLCESSKESFKLMCRYGMDAILNDILISRVLIVAKLAVIFFSCISVYVLCSLAEKIDSTIEILVHIVVVFCASNTVFSATQSVIQSGVSTLFVCICADVEVLRFTQKDFYSEITKIQPALAFEANENLASYVDKSITKTKNFLEDLLK